MSKFKKGDSEYISNGYYSIEGDEYMSIWTFKKRNNISPNFDKVNGPEGIELFEKGVKTYDSIPDFGGYDSVLLYPIDELKSFYQV